VWIDVLGWGNCRRDGSYRCEVAKRHCHSQIELSLGGGR
jgi:hypothetical protein